MFTDKQARELAQLIERWAQGDGQIPLDRRTISKSVQEWVRHYGLVEIEKGRWRLRGRYFNPAYDTPIEVLWLMVAPMLGADGSVGYSINKHDGWKLLNIYPSTSQMATERDMQDRERVLVRLDMAGYLTFLSAGSVWRVDKT